MEDPTPPAFSHKPGAPPPQRAARVVPLWLKVVFAGYAAVLVPTYGHYYGAANFLWYSNVALLLTVTGVLIESPLLISMAAVGVFMPETAWSLDFIVRLATGRRAFGLTEYLWDQSYPVAVRALTLYHLALPPVLWWLVGRVGYDRRALVAWLALAGTVALVVVVTTDPAININRLWGPGAAPQEAMPRAAYLAIWATALPLGLWWPTHRLFLWARPRRNDKSPRSDQSPSAPMTREIPMTQ